VVVALAADWLAGAWAMAAGVSPAAAKAIAHPISLIHFPGDLSWDWQRETPRSCSPPPIGAAFGSLKHVI
jgi:hypothetical protein